MHTTYLEGRTGFDTQETKLPSYWNTSFSKICLGMKIGQQINFIVINKQANSLYSLIADGQYRATSLGRNAWKKLIGSQASLQTYCNKKGFNAVFTEQFSRARIGIVGDDNLFCATCNSRIGLVLEGGLMTPTRVETRLNTQQIMEKTHQSHGVYFGSVRRRIIMIINL